MGDLLDTLDPIFADCVCDESSRYAIDKPWTHSGFAYATDGRIVVRQPTIRSASEPKAPNGAVLFDKSEPSGEPIPLPNIGPELDDKWICKKCRGKNSTKTCGKCKGIGKHISPIRKHERPCRACDGEGSQCCSGCDGKGAVTRQRQSITLAPDLTVGLADFYIWLLQRHGITKVQSDKRSSTKSFSFRKGTVEGLVMGASLDPNAT